jgi:hypothetical protein
MFELAGTHFERGVFELRLHKKLPRLIAFVVNLGAIRGRMLALLFIISGSLLTFNHQPERFLLGNGWVNDPLLARKIQIGATYLTACLGGLLYLIIFFFRQETLSLVFDRHEKSLRFSHKPLLAKMPLRDGMVDFGALEAMEVFSKDRDVKTPNGFMEIRIKNYPEPYKKIRFRFLTDEQFAIYPTNLMKLTGKSPVGDWRDPDDELLKS